MWVPFALNTLQGTLNLNTSQVSSIRQLAQSRLDTLRSIREQVRLEQLMSLLNQADPDPAAVGRATIELKAIHDQARSKQADFERQLSSLLNPMQQQIVNNLRSQAQTFVALRRLGLLGVPEIRHEVVRVAACSRGRKSVESIRLANQHKKRRSLRW